MAFPLLHLKVSGLLEKAVASEDPEDWKLALVQVEEHLKLETCFFLTASHDNPDKLHVHSSTADKLTTFREIEFDSETPFVKQIKSQRILPWQKLDRRAYPSDPLWELIWQAIRLGPYAGDFDVSAIMLRREAEDDLSGILLLIAEHRKAPFTPTEEAHLKLLAHQFYMAVELHQAHQQVSASRIVTESKIFDALQSSGQSLLLHGVFAPLQSLDLYQKLARTSLQRGDTREAISNLDAIRHIGFEVNRVAKSFLQLAATDSSPNATQSHARPRAIEEWVNVEESVQDIEKSLSALARLTGKQLVVRLATPRIFPMRKADFDDVLSNLLHNAIKYSERGSKVKIKLLHDARYSVLDTTSYGIPVLRSDWDKVFQLGYRTPDAVAMNYSAAGIGLHQARRNAENAGAELFVFSSDPVEDIIPFRPSMADVIPRTPTKRIYRTTFRLRSRR